MSSTYGRREESFRGGGRSGAGRGGSDESARAFEGYDEEEVFALEQYQQKHPPVTVDKEGVRRRARELSESIGTGQREPEKDIGRAIGSIGGGSGTEGGEEVLPEELKEYTDASGKLKFNKPVVVRGEVRSRRDGDGKTGQPRHNTKSSREEETNGETKKSKRAKLAKLKNKTLLSFGGEEEIEEL
ncbi:unnamed protein product [Choristocarpus tenellus]